jgi:hypothetical protein
LPRKPLKLYGGGALPPDRAAQTSSWILRALLCVVDQLGDRHPQVTLSVYQQIVATWRGPGLYGNLTACGEKLTKHIVGVADRTLPCGCGVPLFDRAWF